MNAMTEIQPQSPLNGSSALTLELAKCLKLVAPVTMSSDAQMVWLQAAVDSLEGIRAEDVATVSAEVRRKVTRHSQIVPTIIDLIVQRRARSQGPQERSPYFVEKAIHDEAQRRRMAVSAKDKRALSDIWEWERQARIDAGLHVEPYPEPLTRTELDAMPPQIRKLGFAHGFLRREQGQIVEV